MKSAVTNGASTTVHPDLDQVPVTSLRPERVRRPSFMVFGLLLVLLSALAGAILFRASNSRSQALILKNDLAIGQELTTSDLLIVDLDVAPNLQWVSAGDQQSVVGLSARGPMAVGQLVSKSMFTDRAASIGADTVIVAAAVRPGAVPLSVQAGDTVRIQLTSDGDGSPPADPDQSASLGEAVVWSITEVGSGPGEMIVELAVATEAERQVSHAASTGRMKLNLTGAG